MIEKTIEELRARLARIEDAAVSLLNEYNAHGEVTGETMDALRESLMEDESE